LVLQILEKEKYVLVSCIALFAYSDTATIYAEIDHSFEESMKLSRTVPIERTTLSAATFERLIANVVHGTWKAGQQIPTERILCQQLGIARNSLREALKAMELMACWRAGLAKVPSFVLVRSFCRDLCSGPSRELTTQSSLI
jgi:hypothetical protein